MSVSLNLLDRLGAFRVSILSRLARGKVTAAIIRDEVVAKNKWGASRPRVYNCLRLFVNSGFARQIDHPDSDMTFEITEQGRQTLRKAQSFYRSI